MPIDLWSFFHKFVVRLQGINILRHIVLNAKYLRNDYLNVISSCLIRRYFEIILRQFSRISWVISGLFCQLAIEWDNFWKHLHSSFYFEMFLHYIANGKVKIHFSLENVIDLYIEKFLLHDWIYNGYEDWSFVFTTTPWNLLCDLFSPIYWISSIKRKCYHFLNFSSSQPNIYSQFDKMVKKEIVHQVLRGHCKKEASIFNSIIDSVANENCSTFRQFVTFSTRVAPLDVT